MNLAAVKARGLAHQSAESCSGRGVHRWRWLLVTAAWTTFACTLTDDSFEPSPVERIDEELNPAVPNAPLPPDDGAPSMPDDGDGNGTDSNGSDGDNGNDGEPGLGNVPLDPAGTDGDGPGTGTATAGNSGQGNTGEVDAGVGNEPPIVDEPDPPVDEPEPPIVDEPDPPIDEPDPPVTPPCLGTEFGGSCYQAFGDFVAWSVAEQRCVAWGGHLASVESIEEDAFLDGWPAQLGIQFVDGTGVWLGGTDAVVDGDFRWIDGSPLSFRGWASGQPDNGAGGADCIEKRNDGTQLWYDRRCVDAMRFICERPL